MKDLITTIGSVAILMVFVMQFCFNQVTITKVLIADKILDNYQEQIVKGEEVDFNQYKGQLTKCFGIEENEMKVENIQSQKIIKIPIYNVIACGEFLGINASDNKAIYCGVVNTYEESDNNLGNSDSNDHA